MLLGDRRATFGTEAATAEGYTGVIQVLCWEMVLQLTQATSRRKGAWRLFVGSTVCQADFDMKSAKGPGETFAEVATPSELFTWFVRES